MSGQWFRVMWLQAVALFTAMGLWSPAAKAHTSPISGMAIETRGAAIEVELRLDATSCMELVARTSDDVASTPQFERWRSTILAYLDARLNFAGDDRPCPRGTTSTLHHDAQSDRMVVRARYECAAAPEHLGVESTLFEDEDAPHRIMAGVVHEGRSQRYFFGAGETTASITLANLREQVGPASGFGGRIATPPPGAFSRATPAANTDVRATAQLATVATPSPTSTTPATPAGIGRDLWLGVSHILGGPDHVLFVLCLLLAASTGRRLLLVITAFTIAHSVTLVLGTLGLVVVSPRLVEPVIALSIVWVAIEGVWRPQPEARPAAAFGFGLAHGLGFCGVLAGVGLTGGDLAMALVGFNVGVELGQLAVVLAAWPLWIWWQAKHPDRATRARRVVYAVISVVATYWFFERLIA